MLLFRAEEHVERSGKVRGASMTPEQMLQLADNWYHDRADPGWRRKTVDEAEAVFAESGSTVTSGGSGPEPESSKASARSRHASSFRVRQWPLRGGLLEHPECL
jgi:hypothetical protein